MPPPCPTAAASLPHSKRFARFVCTTATFISITRTKWLPDSPTVVRSREALECVQLAAAFDASTISESASKLRALQALRAFRLHDCDIHLDNSNKMAA